MENESKIQEMQFIEQNLQSILMQKQSFQMELGENSAALREIEKAGDEVYKIIGQLMIKSDKNKIIEELKNKEKLLDVRLKSLETQEESLLAQSKTIRKQIIGSEEEEK
jgi:prefoldin beta subunit